MVRILVRGTAIPCCWLFLLRHHDFLMIQPLLMSMISFSTRAFRESLSANL